MKRIDINSKNAIQFAIEFLSEGKIIVYPTDTIYGFGCDATNSEAITNLNNLKGRQSPLSIIAPNKKTAINWFDIEKKEKKQLLKTFENGNTIIAPVKNKLVHKKIKGKNNSVGIRVPNYPFCVSLSKSFDKPITTTSVNKTGSEPHVNPDLIEEEFGKEVPLLIDAGVINNQPSSIFKFELGRLVSIR
tara:strand:- start:362 stop:928 length:567 start_codon:yes stop_codon:yes gene_type:complete